MIYRLHGVGMSFGAAAVLCDINLSMSEGELIAIAGPNGAGKSTLIGILAGLRTGYAGQCELLGREVSRWDRGAFSRLVTFVPQAVTIDFGFTAEQIVMMGRAPFVSGMFESRDDHNAVVRAMEQTGTLPFRARDFRSLSGGEKQRVLMASALAQSPRVLILDEPTAHLDIEHQIQLFRLLGELRNSGVLVIVVSHDLHLSSAYSDRVVLLHGGRCVADGPPAQVLRPETIFDVFHVHARVEHGRIHYEL